MVNIGLATDQCPAIPVEFGSPNKLPVKFLNQGLQLSYGIPLLEGECHELCDRCAKGAVGVFKLDVINRRFRAECRARGSRYCSVICRLGECVAGIFRDPV